MSDEAPPNASANADERLALVLAELEIAEFGGGGRAAPLFAWMWERRNQLRPLLLARRPDWSALSRGMIRAGLSDAEGQPPTASLCRQAWLRVVARERALEEANEAKAAREVPAAPAAPAELVTPPVLPIGPTVREARAWEPEGNAPSRAPAGRQRPTRTHWLSAVASSSRNWTLSDPPGLNFGTPPRNAARNSSSPQEN